MTRIASIRSRLKLPNSEDIAKEFGKYEVGRNASCKVSIATVSIVNDVFNQITIDAQIGPWSQSETEFVFEDHIKAFQRGALVLADRGYPSIKLMVLIFFRDTWKKILEKFDWLTKRHCKKTTIFVSSLKML